MFQTNDKVIYIGNAHTLRGKEYTVLSYIDYIQIYTISDDKGNTYMVSDCDIKKCPVASPKLDPSTPKGCSHKFIDIIGIHGRSLGRSCKHCDIKEEDLNEIN